MRELVFTSSGFCSGNKFYNRMKKTTDPTISLNTQYPPTKIISIND